MSAGQRSETIQMRPGSSATKAQPPTPSTPLASVVVVMDPSSSIAENVSRGASGTPSLSWRSSAAASSSSSHAVLVRPSAR
eukprot:2565867-Pleurochrysis_carterae.AAC.1